MRTQLIIMPASLAYQSTNIHSSEGSFTNLLHSFVVNS